MQASDSDTRHPSLISHCQGTIKGLKLYRPRLYQTTIRRKQAYFTELSKRYLMGLGV